MSANNFQFIQTCKMFRDYLSGYPKDLTFEEWNNAEPDDKAALLYVTFFQEITLAWYDAIISRNIVYVSQEDGVSTVLQYLMKNVDKIAAAPKKYSAEYIYRVAYNCLGCLPRNISAKARAGAEMSNEYSTDDDTYINLWDLVPSEDDNPETRASKDAIWEIIRHMGVKAEKVVNHLINPSDTLKVVSGKANDRQHDRLADVTVSDAEFSEIMQELRIRLAPYKDAMISF